VTSPIGPYPASAHASGRPSRFLSPLRHLGPGLVLAAAGIGAGDVITATVTGAKYGTQLAWALLACVLLKYAINEGLARWQLATGTTIIAACAQRLPRWITVIFFLYLLFWTFFVGGSLTNACGLAGHSLFPQLSVPAWGIIHSVVAATLVLTGRFGLFENLMKALVGVMVITVLICAILIKPHLGALLRDLTWPTLPPGSGKSVLGIFGGIAGSMTVLCYGYWIRENGWTGPGYQRAVRLDLLLAYSVTLLFAVTLTIVAAGCNATATQGSQMALEVASRLKTSIGPFGYWTFLIGFWSAVFTSMLAVWQGVPYLFADFVSHRKRDSSSKPPSPSYSSSSSSSKPSPSLAAPSLSAVTPVTAAPAASAVTPVTPAYRAYLLYLAGPPLILLYAKQPVAMVVLFTVIGAFIMPFLAALLLYLNNRADWMGPLRNNLLRNAALIISLLLFTWVASAELLTLFKPKI
jgi:Mn2+/Fe2+ NRAMP family transporter